MYTISTIPQHVWNSYFYSSSHGNQYMDPNLKLFFKCSTDFKKHNELVLNMVILDNFSL